MKKNEKSPLYMAKDLTEKFHISMMTLHRWVENGLIPKPIKMGRLKYWRREDIDAIINAEPGTVFGGES